MCVSSITSNENKKKDQTIFAERKHLFKTRTQIINHLVHLRWNWFLYDTAHDINNKKR